jgi:oxygen-dependent protoporphyrinogen oxidase
MEKYDVIVVGAGISGMSFAHYAAKANLQTLVLEKANKQGGSFDTYKSQKAGDFWIELGAHTCYNSYRNLIEVMEECGIVGEISPRAKVPFRALVGDQIKSFPSQINFLELLISIPKLFAKKRQEKRLNLITEVLLAKRTLKRFFRHFSVQYHLKMQMNFLPMRFSKNGNGARTF